jgi:hypothetical protein
VKPPHAPDTRTPHLLQSERGISLIEVITGTVITVIAVVGLAYSFGIGRGLIDRYEVARVALSAAQRRMETLTAMPSTSESLATGAGFLRDFGPFPFNAEGKEIGEEWWTVEWIDDPVDGMAPGDATPHDIRRVTVRVIWEPSGQRRDTVKFSRLFSP